MGNRACVVFSDGQRFSPAIYLHWHGGPESVYAFLDALARYDAIGTVTYSAARFAQLACNFFGGTLSVGLMSETRPPFLRIDPGDNGVYLITVRASGYAVRRFKDGVEWSAEAVAAERAAVPQHPYFTDSPSIAERIDAANQQFFQPRSSDRKEAA